MAKFRVVKEGEHHEPIEENTTMSDAKIAMQILLAVLFLATGGWFGYYLAQIVSGVLTESKAFAEAVGNAGACGFLWLASLGFLVWLRR